MTKSRAVLNSLYAYPDWQRMAPALSLVACLLMIVVVIWTVSLRGAIRTEAQRTLAELASVRASIGSSTAKSDEEFGNLKAQMHGLTSQTSQLFGAADEKLTTLREINDARSAELSNQMRDLQNGQLNTSATIEKLRNKAEGLSVGLDRFSQSSLAQNARLEELTANYTKGLSDAMVVGFVTSKQQLDALASRLTDTEKSILTIISQMNNQKDEIQLSMNLYSTNLEDIGKQLGQLANDAGGQKIVIQKTTAEIVGVLDRLTVQNEGVGRLAQEVENISKELSNTTSLLERLADPLSQQSGQSVPNK